MAEQITARIAARIARAFRAAADEAEELRGFTAEAHLRELAATLDKYPADTVSAIAAVLLRELVPEPDGELATDQASPALLVARCGNVTEPDGISCPGRLHYRWGQVDAACDTCGGHCGIAVASWERVEPDGELAEAERALRAVEPHGYAIVEVDVSDLHIVLDELPRLRAEVETLRTELDEIRTWSGLMRILDEHYPPDVVTGESGDPGPRLVALMRTVESLREAVAAAGARDAAAQAVWSSPSTGVLVPNGDTGRGYYRLANPGHMNWSALDELPADAVRLIPAAEPLHEGPSGAATTRARMAARDAAAQAVVAAWGAVSAGQADEVGPLHAALDGLVRAHETPNETTTTATKENEHG